jgi:predicted nuclease with TOPRIM domain
MNPTLASVTEQFLGSWVAAALVIIAGIAALFGIVEFFATKREIKALEGRLAKTEEDLKRLSDKLDRDKTEVIQAGSTRANNLHIRIDELQQQIGLVQGELKTLTPLLAEFIKEKIHAK